MKKINFEKIFLSYFLSTGPKVEHEFGSGIYFVRGENRTEGQEEQNNGVGKTAIFLDSIVFALYGETSRKIKKSGIPYNAGTKKKCIVELDLVVDKKKIKITRSINPSKFTLTVDGENISESVSGATQEYLEREVLGGIKKEVFQQAIAMKIGSSKPFLSMGKPEREKFIGGIFDLSYLKECEKMAREDYNKSAKEKVAIDSKIEVTKPRLKSLIEQVKSAQEEDKKRKKDIENKLAELDVEKYGLDKVEEPTEFTEEFKAEVFEPKPFGEEFKEKTLTKGVFQSKFEPKLEEFEGKLSEQTQALRNTEDSLKHSNFKISTLQTEIKSLEESKSCPTCKRDYDEESLKEIDSTLESKKSEISISEKFNEGFVESIEKYKSNIEKVNSAITKVKQKISEERDSFEDDWSKVVEEENKRKTEFNERKNEFLSKENERKNEFMSKINEKKNEYLERRNEYTLKKKDYEIYCEKLKNIESRIESLTKELSEDKSGLFNKLKEDAKTTKKQLEGLKGELVSKTEELEVLDTVKFIYGDKGLRSVILGRLVDLFNSSLNDYLERLEAPCSIEFNQDFDFVITNLNGDEISFDNLSSGEQLRVTTALAFTFKDILRVQNQVCFNIGFFDEFFDSAGDGRYLDTMSQIIEERYKELEESSYIISHRSDFEIDGMEEILVVKENGKSRIE